MKEKQSKLPPKVCFEDGTFLRNDVVVFIGMRLGVFTRERVFKVLRGKYEAKYKFRESSSYSRQL